MNAYCYDFGAHDVYQETIADFPRYELERCCGVVIAETRGRAKKLAVAHADARSSIEWTTPMHLRLIQKDACGPARIVEAISDPAYSLWKKAGAILDTIDEEAES